MPSLARKVRQVISEARSASFKGRSARLFPRQALQGIVRQVIVEARSASLCLCQAFQGKVRQDISEARSA
eukprot:732291-Heterocapsa_arctica.AAC.1